MKMSLCKLVCLSVQISFLFHGQELIWFSLTPFPHNSLVTTLRDHNFKVMCKIILGAGNVLFYFYVL
jgi:hypothetical protein